ncbi:MAG: amidohydrolase family protein [Coriobacteriia bacterium]|nr:amidohydrolase family protein [Coriobacteriia bacterium]
MLLCAEFVLPVSSEPISKGAVLVRDGEIKDVGSAEMLRLLYPDDEVKEYPQAALMPGLIDLHTHLEKSVTRGLVEESDFPTWVRNVSKTMAKMDNDDLVESATLGALEALSNGVTTVAESTASGASLKAVQNAGLRAFVYREVNAKDKRRVQHAVNTAKRDIEKWQAASDELVTIGIAPGELFDIHPQVMTAVAEIATEKDIPMTIHVGGSLEEYNFVRRGSSAFSVDSMADERGFVEIPPWMPTGATPVRYALNWGAFDAPNCLVVHAVHVDEADILKLLNKDVAIAVCPRVNAQLGMGAAPLYEFIRNGIRVGFGTDSPAATDATDVLTECRLGMLIQRAINPGQFIPAASMLELATLGAARALRIDDRVGSIEVGKRADLIAVNLSGSLESILDPEASVVNTCSGSDVAMTMVDGAIRYEKNRWSVDIDVAQNIVRIIEIRKKLRK